MNLNWQKKKARLRRELAQADEALAQSELDQALAGSTTGSVGRLADVVSEEGNSVGARPRSSHEVATPLINLEETAEETQEPMTTGALAKAGTQPIGHT